MSNKTISPKEQLINQFKQLGLIKNVHWVILEEDDKPFITIDGLLWLANNHPDEEKRAVDIQSQLLQTQPVIIVKSKVTLSSGISAEALGSASREYADTDRLIELAESRATARALRKLYALGTPVEEN
ncbi:hypothetical protein SAMN06265182_0991 [Persephonella hydrogeniphila]|uniref:Uncharacterized protein n=1 Tax=Persephonella hydrogeniphila TaxID=198703 RepID=A0A285NE57_9AQUI|nr:hypothetical protein [Persephonella hydrogeniphila]SNZ07735.1 hypothetical protein SAMN06265182_0991 [Persephonella hydrogeniphila]